MKILLTGGAGFLGSHLVDRFLQDGHSVVCLDNLITGSLSNMEHHERPAKFEFIQLDVTNEIHLPGHFDAVLHLASPASPDDYIKYPIQTLKVGSLGTHKTLGFAKAKGARYLLASTSEVYGDPLVSPQPETYWGNVNPVGPRGVYDEAKRFAEAMATAYAKEHGVKVRIARIFNTYGPRMRLNDGRAIPNFVHQALSGKPLTVHGTGTQTRSFCYVDDLVDGIVRLLFSDVQGAVNIGNPHEVTILEIARLIEKIMGCAHGIEFFPARPEDPQKRKPDISRARSLLGWEPRVSLEEGFTRTIEWYRRQGTGNREQ